MMKRKVTILMIFSLILLLSAGKAMAQTKEEEEKKQEMLKKRQKEEKELQERFKKAQEAYETEIEVRTEEMEKAIEQAREAYSKARPKRGAYVLSTGSDLDNIYFFGESGTSSSMQYSKNVREGSFEKELDFEIEEDAKRASINVSGMCREGEIRIVISMPSGERYTEVLIDEYGSVNWSKTFNIDEENGSRTGEWTFKVSAKNATGNFRLSLKSY